jgi:hypothetical protein
VTTFKVVAKNETFLDTGPNFSYIYRISLAERTAAGDTGWWIESGSRGRGLVASAPGRLRENARPAR